MHRPRPSRSLHYFVRDEEALECNGLKGSTKQVSTCNILLVIMDALTETKH